MLGEALRGAGNPNTWVIASAGPLEYAQQGLFAKAFCDALQRPTTGPSQRFIDPNSIVQAINDAHAGHAQQQARVFMPAAGSTGIPPFFPNPSHQAGLCWPDRRRSAALAVAAARRPAGIHHRVLPHRQDRAAARR